MFLAIGSRRLWLSPSTRKPDAAWVTQQAERFLNHARISDLFLPSPSGRGAGGEGLRSESDSLRDKNLPPTNFLLRDNDVKYPPAFDKVFRQAGVTVPQMPPRAPNLRPHVERIIQTIQSEALDGMTVVNERHLNHILSVTQDWYNKLRPHSRCDHLPPECDKPPDENNTATPSEIVCTTHLGGLLNSYSRRAA